MKKLSLKSYAKLNLYLEVVNRRPDNYHNIRTIFERINLSDDIILKLRPDRKIKIICRSSHIPKDNTNLAFKAAKLLQESLAINQGVEITIVKRIPVGAGLGGGSGNAAYTLLGLNKLWKLNLSREKLMGFARKIGSDVAFFIYESPFALAEAKGDAIKPLKKLQGSRFWHILVVPKIKVSTPMIYSAWDKLVKNRKKSEIHGLTKPEYNVKILTSALLKKEYPLITQALFNGLEPVTISIYPGLKRIRNKLSFLGLQSILMSGSGPAIMAIVPSRKEAVSIYRQLRDKKRWRVYLVQTL